MMRHLKPYKGTRALYVHFSTYAAFLEHAQRRGLTANQFLNFLLSLLDEEPSGNDPDAR